MALYGVRLVINLFDLCIYRRYLEEFIGNRKTSMEFSVLLLIVCELIGSAVNQMGISWLNFVTMVAILCVYVCQYEAGIVSRLIAVLLYMGIIQDIRHDMKNRLTGLLAAAEQGSAELIKDRLQEVLGDIRLAEEIIYSANPVVNAILKVKSIKAKEKEIPMQVTTLLPQRVSVDIGDMGVLYGNLLDNAIEAAMAVEQEKRYVHVESKFQEGRLLLSIKNSKPSGTSSYQQTNKKDKIKHGRGIRSVRKVAEKYGGELLLKDQGEHFEAVLLLNGIATSIVF